MAKARWLATKEFTQDKSSRYSPSPWALTESKYCDAIIEMRYYEKLLSPGIPKAKVVSE
jgi:hypothetical protein